MAAAAAARLLCLCPQRASDAVTCARSRAKMADGLEKGRGESSASFARRVDPEREQLSPAQREFMRQAEKTQWQRGAAQRLRGRNALTGLVIGAAVLGIYGYTFYSISQEKFLDELEEEAKIARTLARKTSAN